MPRKKRSKGRDFSFKNRPALKLRPGRRVVEHQAGRNLADRHYVAQALIECLQDGDAEAFKDILRTHLDVINKSEFAERAHIPERTLYRMVSEEGNPTLENIARVVHALCA